jgi:hypothetical protein
MIQEVDDESLDVRTIMILRAHDQQFPITRDAVNSPDRS